jgi:hypothetical protein
MQEKRSFTWLNDFCVGWQPYWDLWPIEVANDDDDDPKI